MLCSSSASSGCCKPCTRLSMGYRRRGEGTGECERSEHEKLEEFRGGSIPLRTSGAQARSARTSKPHGFSNSVPIGTSHFPPDGGRAPVLRIVHSHLRCSRSGSNEPSTRTSGAHAPVLTNRRASEHRTPRQPHPQLRYSHGPLCRASPCPTF